MTDVNGNDVTNEVTEVNEAKDIAGEAAETVEAAVETTEVIQTETAEAATESAEASKHAEASDATKDNRKKKRKKREKNSFVYNRELVVSDRWNNIILIALVLAVIVGVCIYFLPVNRVKRLVKKGNECYAVEKYDDACKYYQKAVLADVLNPFAAKSLITADMAADNGEAGEDLKQVLEGLDSYKARKGELVIEEENIPAWTDFFLMSPELFNGREDAEVLKRGYEMLGNPSELKPALANAYYEWGDAVTVDNYTEALDSFDKALEFSDNAETYTSQVKEQVTAVIETLKNADEYDKAYEVLKRYESLLNDAASVKENIRRAEELHGIKIELLSQVYLAFRPYYDTVKDTPLKDRVKEDTPLFGMIAENWEKMLMLDGSEKADELAFSFAADEYNYAPEGFKDGFTGIGCGLYPYGDRYTKEDGSEGTGYYFYFGEYKNGKRDGFGMIFIKVDVSSYMAFEGEWKDNLPNGFGASFECDMYSYTSLAEYRRVTFGEYKDGYENGEMTSIALLNEHPDTYFKGSYKAVSGVADSVEGDPINYGIVDPIPEGYKLIAVLASAEAGYDYIIPVYVLKDSVLGVVGW